MKKASTFGLAGLLSRDIDLYERGVENVFPVVD